MRSFSVAVLAIVSIIFAMVWGAVTLTGCSQAPAPASAIAPQPESHPELVSTVPSIPVLDAKGLADIGMARFIDADARVLCYYEPHYNTRLSCIPLRDVPVNLVAAKNP